MQEYTIIVDDEYDGIRLDKALTGLIEPVLSRSYIIKLIEDGNVSVDNKIRKKSYTLTEGNTITLTLPDATEYKIEPENIPLDILYEDDDVIVVNKPSGMVVHPAAGHLSGTLVNALMYHCGDSLSGINGILRPGIVHRIDKDTSGSIIACKNDASHASIAGQLKDHSLDRTYRALCIGEPKEDEFTVNAPIGRDPKDRKKMAVVSGGKEAVTNVTVLARLVGASYIECRLKTGRTHQIRVHMESIGHPLIGDEVYNKGPKATGIWTKLNSDGQALHAYKLGFTHPTTNKRILTVAPIPEYMASVVEKFGQF
ncbi:MAG: RluA family pseudouridine synthase [Lachnospiraceae bacterium]|nr:RluA family pseudouridine synthase [Lachnospiraceae bacterium]